MKTFIKILKLLISIVLISVLSTSILAVVSLNNEPYEKPLKIVFLGDSISEGILGPTPVHERDSYAFYGVISEINKYDGHNRAVSGHRTFQFEQLIKDGDKNAYLTGTHLREADVITISMLANDLLQLGPLKLILDRDAANIIVQKSLNRAKGHFISAIEELKRINPNAYIMMLTQYNPAMETPSMYTDAQIEMIRATGIEPSEYREYFQVYIDMLNNIITGYLEEHPGAYHIIDVAKAFDDIYKEDPVRAGNLLFKDVLHPSNEGHAVIGGVIQKKLEELGLADREKALINYKDLRAKQANRLFTGIIDVDSLVKKINASESYEEVTKVFFAATNNHTINTKDMIVAATPKQPAKYATEEITLPVKSVSVNLIDSTLLGIVLDFNSSYVKFNTDGTMEIILYLNDGVANLLNSLLGGMNLSNLRIMGTNISGFLDVYGDIFLGRDENSTADSFKTIKESLGLEFIGIDFTEPPFSDIARALDETGSLPPSFSLPTDRSYGLRISSRYEISSVKDFEGNVHNVIYLGKTGRRVEPYIIMGTELDVDGNPEKIDMRIEFLDFSLSATSVYYNAD